MWYGSTCNCACKCMVFFFPSLMIIASLPRSEYWHLKVQRWRSSRIWDEVEICTNVTIEPSFLVLHNICLEQLWCCYESTKKKKLWPPHFYSSYPYLDSHKNTFCFSKFWKHVCPHFSLYVGEQSREKNLKMSTEKWCRHGLTWQQPSSLKIEKTNFSKENALHIAN